MAPRMTNAEAIAALEAKLAETKAKAEEKIQAQIAATQAKLDEAKAKAGEREASRVVKLDERIVAAKLRVSKANEALAKLEAERAELIAKDDESEGEQPELPAEDTTPAGDEVTTRRGRKSDAA